MEDLLDVLNTFSFCISDKKQIFSSELVTSHLRNCIFGCALIEDSDHTAQSDQSLLVLGG